MIKRFYDSVDPEKPHYYLCFLLIIFTTVNNTDSKPVLICCCAAAFLSLPIGIIGFIKSVKNLRDTLK